MLKINTAGENMSIVQDLQEVAQSARKIFGGNFFEIRAEENTATRLRYEGREIEEIASATSFGGCIRATTGNGWGFVSFNSMDNLLQRIEIAITQSKLIAGDIITLKETKPVIDKVDLLVKKDPRLIPLSQKKALMDEYNDLIWGVPKIQTSAINYADTYKKVIFINSEGSHIEQSRIDVVLRIAAIARDNGEVQQAGISLGSNGDYSVVENLHHQVKEISEKASAMLSAPKIPSGEYTVILDPILAGVFIHEAFGHLSESDIVYDNQKLKDIMVLGRRFGGNHLNVIDGAAINGLRGSFKYDDEGVPATRTYLIKDGILVGRLHSRETAARMGEDTTGNARAINYHFPPIVRMTNTYIEPQKTDLDGMLAEIKNGIYACNWYGGQTSMEMFTFSAGEAYLIHNGRIDGLIRPVILSGNLFTTLENIDAIGNDLQMNQGGGCGKGEQNPLPVSNGSPHIRISRCLIGGK